MFWFTKPFQLLRTIYHSLVYSIWSTKIRQMFINLQYHASFLCNVVQALLSFEASHLDIVMDIQTQFSKVYNILLSVLSTQAYLLHHVKNASSRQWTGWVEVVTSLALDAWYQLSHVRCEVIPRSYLCHCAQTCISANEEEEKRGYSIAYAVIIGVSCYCDRNEYICMYWSTRGARAKSNEPLRQPAQGLYSPFTFIYRSTL